MAGQPSGYWNLKFFLSNSVVGATEQITWSGSKNILDAFAIAQKIATLRACLLGQGLANSSNVVAPLNPAYVAVRVSDAFSTTYSANYNLGPPAYAGYDTVQGNSSPDLSSTAYVVRIKGQNSIDGVTQSVSTHTFQLNPDNLYENSTYNGTGILLNMVSWDQYLLNYLNTLCNPQFSLGYMGESTLVGKLQLNTFTRAANGLIQFNAPTANWYTGDQVEFSAVNSKGIAGVHKVIYVSDFVYQIATPLTNVVVLPTLAKGLLVRTNAGVKQKQFYQFIAPPGGWVSNPGKFGVRRFSKPYSTVSFRRRR